MTLSKRMFEVLILGLTLVCLSWSVAAARPVKVGLDVIEASKGPGVIDPRLRKVTSTLVSSFPTYKTFKLLKSARLELSQGLTKRLPLAGGLEAELTLESETPEEAILRIKVPQKNASIRVKARRGGLFFQAMKWRKKTYLLAVHGG